MMSYMWGYNPGLGIFGMIVSLVFWVLFIAVIIMLARWAIRGGRGEHWVHRGMMMGKPPDSALEILKERYAKGEIKKEEFEEKKKDLME